MKLEIDSIRATVITDLIEAEQTAINAKLAGTEAIAERRILINRYRVLKDLYVDVNDAMLRPATSAPDTGITFDAAPAGSPKFVFQNGITVGKARFSTKGVRFSANDNGILRGFEAVSAPSLIDLRRLLENVPALRNL